MRYEVYFLYYANYGSVDLNVYKTGEEVYLADSVDEVLNEIEEDWDFDDSFLIDPDIDDLLDTGRRIILIKDENNNIVYPSMDFNDYEDGKILVSFNIGTEVYDNHYKYIDEHPEDCPNNDCPKISDKCANETLDKFVEYLNNLFGNIVSDIKVFYDKKLVDYQKGQTIKNVKDLEEIHVHMVLNKKLSAELLNAKFLEMEEFHFVAIYPEYSEPCVRNCYIKQEYDNGEYDTGYFTDGGGSIYCNRVLEYIPEYLEVKKLLHIDDGIEV